VAHIPVDGKAGPADVCVIELGGTIGTVDLETFFDSSRLDDLRCYFLKCWIVMKAILNAGDIESMPFIEAMGQFSYRVGEDFQFMITSAFLLHICYIPTCEKILENNRVTQ